MKIKSWIAWLLVVVFLTSEVFLYSANQKKNDALVQVQAAKQQVEELQSQLAQLKSSNAGLQDAAVSKLRAENQDLPRLRIQIAQLQAANQKLSQQLNVTLSVAQQRQAQLEQAAAATQQSDAENICINNLRQLDAAENQWALENNKPTGTVPTEQDVATFVALYVKGGMPVCPSGGIYTINAVGAPPACSVPGHVLP